MAKSKAPAALLSAARRLLDTAEPETVGLREIARHTGISATAAYKHFADKDDLMAAVAAEGFVELASTMRAAASEPDGAVAVGLAYVQFARANRGLFRLMFGPLLAVGAKHLALRKAADEAVAVLEASVGEGGDPLTGRTGSTATTLAVMHGLSCLLIAHVVSDEEAIVLAREVLEGGMRATVPH